MKAKDLMIPLQDYLSPDITLKEAVNLLRVEKNRAHHFVICDAWSYSLCNQTSSPMHSGFTRHCTVW